MGWALRRERIRYELEDGGGFDWVASVPDGPYVDAMEDAETFTDYQAEHEAPGPWRCDDCGQRWPGERRNCGYCGYARTDI